MAVDIRTDLRIGVPYLFNTPHIILTMTKRVKPEKVLFKPRGQNSTVVFWDDGTKTVVKCDDRDTYNKEAGLALCYMKKMLGSSRAFNDVLKEWAE